MEFGQLDKISDSDCKTFTQNSIWYLIDQVLQHCPLTLSIHLVKKKI